MPEANPGPSGEANQTNELNFQSELVHRAGRLALSAGHGSYRVKSHMERVGQAVGLDQVKSRVALTEIATTAAREPHRITEVSEVRHIGINADRLAELEQFIGSLNAAPSSAVAHPSLGQNIFGPDPTTLPMDQLSPEQRRAHELATSQRIATELDRISHKPPLYPPWVNALAAGVACAAFAFLNSGGWIECAVVLIAATVGQLLRRSMISRGINQVGVTMLAAAVASLIYLAVIAGATWAFDLTSRHLAGYVSAVLFLVPGFPLVTGALDLARLDLSAGIARLTYALLILSSAAISLWFVSTIAGLAPTQMMPSPIPAQIMWPLKAVASFIGVFGFAIMFNSPLRMALGAATIGMIANEFRLVVVSFGLPPQAAAAIAALLVGLMARAVASWLRVPRLTVSVPAVVIMVPGVLAYRAVYEFNAGNSAQAIGFTAEAVLVVVSLAIGLAVARMLTDREWTFETF